MSPLLETICLLDGTPCNLSYHHARLNSSREQLFGYKNLLDISKAINIPVECRKGKWKCRVIYAKEIIDVQFLPYLPKPIQTLTCVNGDKVDYPHKYLDRTQINELMQNISTDDILIVKHGLITDTSKANIAFYDGSKWITPARPLLAGTTRARLLQTGAIEMDDISINALKKLQKASLFNAMNDFNPSQSLPIACSIFNFRLF